MKNVKLTLRNLTLVLAGLVFAVGILGTSVVRTTAQAPALVPTPTKADYYLPYPGILPDHLLYPVKMVRDRVWLFLTVDKLKKAELLLLFADKRLGAGKALVEGGKVELGVSTLTKAEKYLERAVEQAKLAQKAGKDTAALYEKLQKAALKHDEVLSEIETRVPSETKGLITKTKEYSRQAYEELTK